MRDFKPIAITLGILVALVACSLVFRTDTPDPKNEKIAEELLELHRQWDTTNNIPSLYYSLTNLPFHKGGVYIEDGNVSRRYNVLGFRYEQDYFIYQPKFATNSSEWTLYHVWYWYPHGWAKKTLAIRKLTTITSDNPLP